MSDRDLVLRAAVVVRHLRKQLARVRGRNAELRARVTKLEAARDRWRARATSYRDELNVLRARAAWLEQSRDSWKARALSKRAQVCAGCGCLLDEQTDGCRACYKRHWTRGVRAA